MRRGLLAAMGLTAACVGSTSRAAELGALAARPNHSLPASRAVLEALLAEPRYQRRDTAAWRRLDDAPKDPKEEPPPERPWMGGAGGEPAGFTWFAGVLAVGAAVAAMFVGLRAWRSRRRGARASPPTTGDAAPSTAGPSALDDTPEGWAAAARALADRGQYEAAARALYLSLVAQLHAAQLLRYDPALTNGDLVRELRSAASVREAFAAVTRTADAVLYGHRPLAPERYARFESACAALALHARGAKQEATP